MAIMFRNLQIGERFEFDRLSRKADKEHQTPQLEWFATSLASGPWIKTSARKYRLENETGSYQVGTVKVSVRPEIGEPTGLAMALFTATQWHSDGPDGINLLSLGSTRKVHSESHRAGCLAEIGRNLAYSRSSPYAEYVAEIPRLEYLRAAVQAAEVGEEWLTDSDNLRINGGLYRTGALAC